MPSNIRVGSATLAATGNSTGVWLDPTARATTVLVNLDGWKETSSNGSDLTLQVTYDTPLQPGYSEFSWCALSTTHFSSASVSLSSNLTGNGLVLTVVGPIAGLRMSSTTWDSDAGTVTMKVLQSITAGP